MENVKIAGLKQQAWNAVSHTAVNGSVDLSAFGDELARLIVKECISIFNYDPDGKMSSFGEWSSNSSTVETIKKHFGF